MGGAAEKLPFTPDKEYDVIVIGGGSGGLSFVQEARELGLSVAVFDYVQPTTHGTTWGLGGTCVNVGCIPKKLFHIGVGMQETAGMTKWYGWKTNGEKPEHDWDVLRDGIQAYIRSINFSYKSKMSEIGADYVNAFAKFENENEVTFEFKGKTHKLKAKNFVIAAGGRPRDYPGIPDLAEHAITSDDLFSLKEDPGKTLVIGGGYIALECAGFLAGLGKDVTMINRSTFLRVMDDDMSFRIVDDMEAHGVKALTQTVPVGVKKLGDRLFEVELKTGDKLYKMEVNTILVAIGRDSHPEKFNIQNTGVELARSHKIKGRSDEMERSNVDHIYAIGDNLEDCPELQPVASKSGKLLAHRIHQRLNSKLSEQEILSKYSMDYKYIPTTVFSPTEYSFIGMTEEEAIKAHGEENIEVYQKEVTPL